MSIMNSFINDTFERIALESSKLVRYNKKASGKRPSKTNRASAGKPKTKKRTETFSLYIYRVLKHQESAHQRPTVHLQASQRPSARFSSWTGVLLVSSAASTTSHPPWCLVAISPRSCARAP